MRKYYTLFVPYKCFIAVSQNFFAKQVYDIKKREKLHSACIYQLKTIFCKVLVSHPSTKREYITDGQQVLKYTATPYLQMRGCIISNRCNNVFSPFNAIAMQTFTLMVWYFVNKAKEDWWRLWRRNLQKDRITKRYTYN